jgi:hypothetical protein
MKNSFDHKEDSGQIQGRLYKALTHCVLCC